MWKSKELVKRLTPFVAPGDAALMERHLYINSRVKAINEGVYISVDRIQTAIAERRKIAFRYFDYSPAKERVHRHDGQIYFVSPYALLWNNDIYYLVGFHEHRQQIAKFRVDRIDGLRITQEVAVQKPKDFDVSAYFTQEFSMLNGEECKVRLLCENLLMNSIIDRFGEDVATQVVDDNHFSVEAAVDLSSNFYGWVFASAGKMRIVEPQEAVALICCESGKLDGLPLNRALRDADGDIYDIVAGNFFIVGLGESDFTDLPHELAEQFAEQFRQPEMFMRVDGKIVAAPMPDEQVQGGMSY